MVREWSDAYFMILKISIRVAIVAIILLVGFMLSLRFVGDSLVATTNHSLGAAPTDLPIETLEIASESGSNLAAWFAPNVADSATVILLHPIRSDRRSMLGRARLLYAAGYSVLLVDLQAHGESPGEQITVGHLEKYDVRAIVNYVKARFPDHKIGIVGCSLGGASTLLASPLGVDVVVIESVYPTVEEAVYNRVGMRLGVAKHIVAPALLNQLEGRLGISKDDLRPIDFIKDAGCPILIATGDLDEHTPLAEAQSMFEVAQEPKLLVVFEGAAHEDLLKFDETKYRAKILEFMEINLRSEQSN